MALSCGFGDWLRRGRGEGNEGYGDGADDGDEHIHVGRQMEEAMPETQGDTVGVEVGGGVVAEVFGIAEDEAGLVAVVGVPGDEGEDG